MGMGSCARLGCAVRGLSRMLLVLPLWRGQVLH